MIHRIIYEDWQLIFPLVALLVAAMVYIVAVGMKPAQAGRVVRPSLDAE